MFALYIYLYLSDIFQIMMLKSPSQVSLVHLFLVNADFDKLTGEFKTQMHELIESSWCKLTR